MFAPNAVGRHVYAYNEAENTQYIQLPANPVNTTNGFTFEAWIYPIGWNYNTRIFDLGDIHLGYVYQQPRLEFGIGSTVFTVAMPTAKTWHHIVTTIPAGGGTGRVYIDGVEVGSGNVGAMTRTTRPAAYVGRTVDGSGNYLYGSYSQIALYGSALSAAQIAAHYQAGIADADPVWHGPDEWSDTAYFNQFTNATPLANNNYVMTGDWMPPVMYSATEVAAMKPYIDVGVAVPDSTNYSWYRDNGMYLLPFVASLPTGTRGSETIGYFVDDEADMAGQEGYNRMASHMALVPSGYMAYANFGIFITMGMGGVSPTREDFFNMAGLDVKSVDQYLYSMSMVDDTNALRYWGVPNTSLRRAYAYGYLMERARSVQDSTKPLWAFVELAHPYNAYTTGGPNPNQVEGAVWGSIIGGARGIMYFHHSFGMLENDTFVDPPTWSATTNYGINDCVTHNGTLYYAALKPAVGEAPTVSSYTWVRWSRNSAPGIHVESARHPDLLNRLVKIKADLQAMAPAINSPTTPHLCHKDIYSTYRPHAHDNKKYIFAMPGHGAPNGGTFDMYLPKGETPTAIEVVGENRAIVPANGKFTDSFAAECSHHIYRW